MRTFVIVFASLLIAGCSSEPPASPGPTYAEAVATYQAEVALLDSLLAKQKAIEDEYDATMKDLLRKVEFSDEYTRAILDARGKVIGMSLEQVGEMLFCDAGDDIGLKAEKWVAGKRSVTLIKLKKLKPQFERQHELVKKAEEIRDALADR